MDTRDIMTIRNRLEKSVLAGIDRANKPMQWGIDDCALWVADIQRDALGYDPGAPFRGRYKTRLGALRVTGVAGMPGVARKVARRHGWKRVDPRLAKPGDGGLTWTTITVRGKQTPILATVICRAPGWFVGRNEGGVTALRASEVAMAWSVLDDAALDQPSFSNWRMFPGPNQFAGIRLASPNHEPVSIGLAILSFVGITGASTLVAGLVGGVVLAALSVGVSMVASLLRPSQGAGVSSDYGIARADSIQAVQVTERQSIPIKRLIVGSAYVGGALCAEKVTAPYLTVGVMFNHGMIDGVEKLYIGTNQVAFNAITPNTILTPLAVDGQPDYASKLRVSFRYGRMDQAADQLWLARYPEDGANFRQAGIATAFYEFHYGGTDNSAATQAAFTALWGQVARPNCYVVARGVVCYDPRDPTQIRTDASTWKWSNNATLVQTWYLTRPFGGRIPMNKIRWDKTAESAEYDDTLIGCKDGTMIKRHTIDGVITLNQQPFQVMQDLLAANRAMLLDSGGMKWIQSSVPRSPVVTIHDRCIASGIKYQSARQKSDLINKLQLRFVSPDQEYQLVDGPAQDNTDLQAEDGEVLPATLALKYTQDHRRAQRLAKLFLLSSRLGRTIQVSTDLMPMVDAAEAGEDLIGSVVTFDSQLFPQFNGIYLVTAVGFADDANTLSLALTEYSAALESEWNPEVDEQDFEPLVA